MKKHLLLVLGAIIAPAITFADNSADSLDENVAFYCSFDGSVEPDQARGSDKIIVGNFDKNRFSYIDGVNGKAVLGGDNVQSLRFKIKENVDFAAPGSVVMWFNPVDWQVQTPDTPTQGQTKWKKTYAAGFFSTSYHPKGYIVLQRTSSHVPGNMNDVIMLVFPCFTDIKKSNVNREVKLDKNTWHQLAMTWDGLNYIVYMDAKEILRTSVPYKLTAEKLHQDFVLSQAKGLAYDEFTIYDKQLSAEEITSLYNKFRKNAK